MNALRNTVQHAFIGLALFAGATAAEEGDDRPFVVGGITDKPFIAGGARTASHMAKRGLTGATFPLRPHEPMARYSCQRCLGGSSPNRLDPETAVWGPPHAFSSQPAGVRIRLSRQ